MEALTGFLLPLSLGWIFVIVGVLFVTLAFMAAPLRVWTAAALILLLGFAAPTWLLGVALIIGIIVNVPPLRRLFVTSPIMILMKKLDLLPVISETERAALEAGTVWLEGELFSGSPNFKRILDEPWPELTEREKAFLDGPVEELCAMVEDWEVFQQRDLPEEAWQYMKDHGFFGLIIPEEFGGKQFSPTAVSSIIGKLCSRSGPLGISAMVPNSLGPGELISHYGTGKQKEHWLPRLASGEDLPCFALTEPAAGSDAGAMTSSALVFRDSDGNTMLKLNWNKRYISLAGRATVLGLAVILDDPDNLLGKGASPGITCVLVPATTPGVKKDLRHDPLSVPFSNCPLEGEDVVVSAENIIGGKDGAGQGWRMLMECLAAGRGVMLPAQATAGIKLAGRATGAYSLIRKQFGMPIGRFEGIVEPLARLGGWAYVLGAGSRFTCGALAGGAKPAVVSAIAKYNFTEIFRHGISDAMDIVGGAGIVRGPRNMLAHAHMATPIAITVEGANILTRTLMIFGQGAIRCHPYAYQEIKALGDGDRVAFDQAFTGHIGHVIHNLGRSLVLTLTRGFAAPVPLSGLSRGYARKLAWASASFAFTADVAMAALGGSLKRRESLTGRFSDALSWMYLCTAVMRRFEADGQRREDEPFYRWGMEYGFKQIQDAMDGIYRNFDVPVLGWLYSGPIRFWSRLNSFGSGPSDRLDMQVARAMQTPGEQRDRLFDGLYIPKEKDQALGRIEHAFVLCVGAEKIVRRVKDAIRDGRLEKGRPVERLDTAIKEGVISEEEAKLVREAEEAREDVIQVDSFTEEEYMASAIKPDRAGNDGIQSRSDSINV